MERWGKDIAMHGIIAEAVGWISESSEMGVSEAESSTEKKV
jgi:hypothetical protein